MVPLSGVEFLLNAPSALGELSPDIAGLNDGGFVAIWRNENTGAANVIGRVFNSDGTPRTSEFTVNTQTTNLQHTAAVAALNGGGFAVVWVDNVGDSSGSSIQARVYSAAGTPLADEFQVNFHEQVNQNQPTIAATADGGFFVSFTDNSQQIDPGDGISGRLFSATGTPVSGQFGVHEVQTGVQKDSNTAVLTNGNVVATWVDQRQVGGDTSIDAVRAQIVNGTGGAVSADFLVNTNTLRQQQDPYVEALAGGGFVIAWRDFSHASGNTLGTDVRLQVYAADGSKTGSEILVNATLMGNQGEPVIAGLPDGRFVVSWSGNGDIMVQVFSATGIKDGNEFLAHTGGEGFNQNGPTIDVLADGRFIVAYKDFSSRFGDTNGSIVAQIFDPRPGAAISALYSANSDTAKGLAAAYQVLLGGVPNEVGFSSLINSAISTNFGAGGDTVFNSENIFINLFNNLVQGNQAASAQFATLAGAGTLSDQITALYNALVPESSRSAEGLAFFNRSDALSFYTASALERGIMSDNGPAVIAAAAILRVAVRDDIPGLGDNVNDLFMAVTGNSAALPASGNTLTDINIADGTTFDGDDVPVTLTAAVALTATSAGQSSSNSDLEEGLTQPNGSSTTASTMPVDSAPTIQVITSPEDELVFDTARNDIIELDFDLAGTALGDGSAASVDGTNLLAALQGLSVESDGGSGYLVAYQDGNAFVYSVQESMDYDNILEASDIQLIGTHNGVSVGELDILNLDFV